MVFIHRGILDHDVFLCEWFFYVDINFEDVLPRVLQYQVLELGELSPAPVVEPQHMLVTWSLADQGTDARVDLLYGQSGLVITRPAQLSHYPAEVRGPEVRDDELCPW